MTHGTWSVHFRVYRVHMRVDCWPRFKAGSFSLFFCGVEMDVSGQMFGRGRVNKINIVYRSINDFNNMKTDT